MLDWSDLRYFLALARAGTLAEAAAVLRINATTVGRRLGALEEHMHARLFDRSSEGFTLTLAGRDLLVHAERMEREALAIEREVEGADTRPDGVVRLSTTEMLATRFLSPHLPRFHERHPGLTLELGCTPRSVSLARHEADVVLRLTRPHEDDVVARALTSVHLALYASRAYLARRGAPVVPVESLREHQVLAFADGRAFALENQWMAPLLEGAQVVLRSDSVSSIYAAALAGSGIALLPRAVADGEPELARLPTSSEPEPRVIWQGVHKDLLRSARVQAVLAFLGEVVATER